MKFEVYQKKNSVACRSFEFIRILYYFYEFEKFYFLSHFCVVHNTQVIDSERTET